MLALGLMSGTSRDGIDAALIETDGEAQVKPLGFTSLPYSDDFRALLERACTRALALDAPAHDGVIAWAQTLLEDWHLTIIDKLTSETGLRPDVIGMHGHTIAHRPERGWSWQMGDGKSLSDHLGLCVVNDFRRNDVEHKGQGAPLIPIYHAALMATAPKPCVLLNLGGVGNITALDEGGAIFACDTGPGNALIDDWVQQHGAGRYDAQGALAGAGAVDEIALAALLNSPYFKQPLPKSLERAAFTTAQVQHLPLIDGAATLTAFSAQAVARALHLLPFHPREIIVCGGGRHNPVLMRAIARATGCATTPIETLGRNGDALEAEGFAYLAVRCLKGLPISFPKTTGAPHPLTGGVVHGRSRLPSP
jgi:anhydro-N-acetylmuramic acid kinase